MSYLYKIMTHDPIDIGWEDDSFAENWGWNSTVLSVTRDGDIVEVKTNAGYYGGAVEKTGFSVNAATYKYLIICVRGNAKRYTEIYDGAWKWVEGAYPDAPSEYDVLIHDLSGITTGTVTGIRLGVYGGELKSAWYDLVAFCSVHPSFATDKVISLHIIQKETDIDEFELLGTEDIGSGLTIGRHVRIWLKGIGNARKVFAGVIEEATPEDRFGRVYHVSGRCFGQKLLLRTKSKTFSNREVSLAVKDFVEDLTEITKHQVETPNPAVYITKDYKVEYIMDGLKDLANWAGSDWEVKLGMGHDLRFRSRSSANVHSVPFSITEAEGHILRNVRKETDGLRLFNKVTVVGGPLYNHDGDKDAWTESTSGWTLTPEGPTLTAHSPAPIGNYYLQIGFTSQNQVWCERSISSIDATKCKSLRLHCRHNISGDNWNVWIHIGQDYGNRKTFPLKALGGGAIPSERLTEIEIPLNHPSWTTYGSPNMAAVTWIEINPGCVSTGSISGTFDFDGLHFYRPNIVKTASASTDFRHTREYIYRDEKITDPNFAQEVADALLNILKDKENRFRLPLVGVPSVQVGYKANVVSPTHGLNETYYIVEAEHKLTPRDGYITEMTLEKPRLSLETLLAEAIERKIKLIERGGIA